MDLSDYTEVFNSEAQELLQALNDSLINLENNPEELSFIEEIFRAAHTLKGMAATMNFNEIAELTHEMEALLDKIRKNVIKPIPEIIDLIFSSFDVLQEMVNSRADNKIADTNAAQIIKLLQDATKGKSAGGQKQSKVHLDDLDFTSDEVEKIDLALSSGKNILKARIFLADDCVIKGARAYMVQKAVLEIGEILKTYPEKADIEDEKFDLDFILFISSEKTLEEVQKKINNISEIAKVEINLFKLDKKKKKKEKIKKTKEPAKDEAIKPKQDTISSALAESQTVRVKIGHLDNLVDLAGELVITRSKLERLAGKINYQEINEVLDELRIISTNLQTKVMETRMVPVGNIFNRFPRMVRDIARRQGKKVNFQMEGNDIELDRTVLDEIGDPLVHLLRNAVSYGVEEPEERKISEKPETGLIRLTARREKNNVVIAVSDDGPGMDVNTIKEKAIEKGFLSPQEIAEMNDAEAKYLICYSGFTTTDTANEISGRGVGMDVVKGSIEALGGNLIIDTQIGVGSTFTLMLPLTLAIIQALLVKVESQIFAIPLSSIDEVYTVNQGNIKTVKEGEVINVHGNIIPLIRLRNIFNFDDKDDIDAVRVVVVDTGENQKGIIVDSLFGQQEIVIKPLDRMLKNLKGLGGATVLGDGQVALILDVRSLLARQ